MKDHELMGIVQEAARRAREERQLSVDSIRQAAQENNDVELLQEMSWRRKEGKDKYYESLVGLAHRWGDVKAAVGADFENEIQVPPPPTMTSDDITARIRTVAPVLETLLDQQINANAKAVSSMQKLLSNHESKKMWKMKFVAMILQNFRRSRLP